LPCRYYFQISDVNSRIRKVRITYNETACRSIHIQGLFLESQVSLSDDQQGVTSFGDGFDDDFPPGDGFTFKGIWNIENLRGYNIPLISCITLCEKGV